MSADDSLNEIELDPTDGDLYGGVLQTEDVSKDDKEGKNGEPEETCTIETGDADDDNDEFVKWNEGDGNVDCFCSFAPCTYSNQNFMSV